MKKHQVILICIFDMFNFEPNLTSSSPPCKEPRDIIWKNISVDYESLVTKQKTAAIIVAFGILFWAIIISSIQVVSNGDSLCM